MKKVLIGMAAAAMAVVGVGGAAYAAPEFDEDSVYDVIQAEDTLYARILQAAGLDSGSIDLGNCGSGPQYTVFLPAFDAIVALVEKLYEVDSADPEFDLAVDALLADKTTLRGLLALHVHGGTLTRQLLLTDGYTTIPTLGGLNLTKTVDESDFGPVDSPFINGFELVPMSETLACNGVVHLMAGVITPPTAPAAPACGATYAGTAQCPAGTSGSGSGLPKTGSESMALTYAALASLIAGAGVLVIRRRSIA